MRKQSVANNIQHAIQNIITFWATSNNISFGIYNRATQNMDVVQNGYNKSAKEIVLCSFNNNVHNVCLECGYNRK